MRSKPTDALLRGPLLTRASFAHIIFLVERNRDLSSSSSLSWLHPLDHFLACTRPSCIALFITTVSIAIRDLTSMVGVVKYADVSTISMVVDGGEGMSTASRSRRVLSRIALTRDTCTRRVRLDTTVHCCRAAAVAAARRNIYLLQHGRATSSCATSQIVLQFYTFDENRVEMSSFATPHLQKLQLTRLHSD